MRLRLASRTPIKIPAGCTTVLSGSVRTISYPAGKCALIKRPSASLPGGLCVKNCLITLPSHAPHRIPVMITNESDQNITLPLLSIIAELSLSPQVLIHHVSTNNDQQTTYGTDL